jgi:hypothetical protein
LALEGQHFGEVTALWTLKSELLAPFQLARRVKCHPGSLGSGGSSLPELLNASQNPDLSEKTSKNAEVVRDQAKKSELHSTKMALVKPLLCRNLGLRYLRAK